MGLPEHGGPDHFLAPHHRLVPLLDAAVSLEAELEVIDEAGHREDRGPEQLRAVRLKHNRTIAAVKGGIGDALEKRGVPRKDIVAPIHEHPPFEHLEAEGLRGLQQRKDRFPG